MKGILQRVTPLLIIAVLGIGCEIVLEIDETSVQVRNDMQDLIAGSDDVTGIDLYGITIGNDVYFSRVNAGATSDERVTDGVGDVDIVIDSAIAEVEESTLGVIYYTDVTIREIDPMETTLTSGEVNTVTFDEYTAESIINALAKKRSGR